MKNSIRCLLLSALFAFTLTGIAACAPASGPEARLRFLFERRRTPIDLSQSLFTKSVVPVPTTVPDTAASPIPQQAADFDCFALNIMGPDIPSRMPIRLPAVQRLPGIFQGSRCSYPGVASRLITRDQITDASVEVELSVPVGKNRVIQVLGLQGPGCVNGSNWVDTARDAASLDLAFTSAMELGRKTEDIFQSKSIEVPKSYDPDASSETVQDVFCALPRGIWASPCYSVGSGVYQRITFEILTEQAIVLKIRRYSNPGCTFASEDVGYRKTTAFAVNIGETTYLSSPSTPNANLSNVYAKKIDLKVLAAEGTSNEYTVGDLRYQIFYTDGVNLYLGDEPVPAVSPNLRPTVLRDAPQGIYERKTVRVP